MVIPHMQLLVTTKLSFLITTMFNSTDSQAALCYLCNRNSIYLQMFEEHSLHDISRKTPLIFYVNQDLEIGESLHNLVQSSTIQDILKVL